MKKLVMIFLVILCISFVSAGWQDIWNKITGKVTENITEAEAEIEVEPEPEPPPEPDETCIEKGGETWAGDPNCCEGLKVVSDCLPDQECPISLRYCVDCGNGVCETYENWDNCAEDCVSTTPPEQCEEGKIKYHECSDGTKIPECECENDMWVCKVSVEDDCPDVGPGPETCAASIKINFDKTSYVVGEQFEVKIGVFDSQGNPIPNYPFYVKMYDDRWHTPNQERTGADGYLKHAGTAEKLPNGITKVEFNVYTKEIGSCGVVEDTTHLEIRQAPVPCGIGGCVPEPECKDKIRMCGGDCAPCPDENGGGGEIFYPCRGCDIDGKCYPLGYRKETMYCSDNYEFVNQIEEGKCDNSFECKSNVCVSGGCISEGLIKKIMAWFKKMFGGGEEEEETKVEVSGDVELSSETQATLDSLVASFKGVEGKIELKLKIKKKDNITEIEEEEVEGTLTEEQNAFWEQLKEQSFADVESAEGDDLELEIEIEHKLEIEEEPEPKICSKLLIEKDIGDYEYEKSGYGENEHAQIPVYSENGENIGTIKCCMADYSEAATMVCAFDSKEELRTSLKWILAGERGTEKFREYKGEKVIANGMIAWTSKTYLIVSGGKPEAGNKFAEDIADAYLKKYKNDFDLTEDDIPYIEPKPFVFCTEEDEIAAKECMKSGGYMQSDPSPDNKECEVYTGCSTTAEEDYDPKKEFLIKAELVGELTLIDFETLTDGTVLQNGDKLTGKEWESLGVVFETPSEEYLKVFGPWQPFNPLDRLSLSPGFGPFESGSDTHDDLTITFGEPVKAAGIYLLDLGETNERESITFLDANNNIIKKISPWPKSTFGNPAPGTFVGLVHEEGISKIEILENTQDGDDIAYDNLYFVK